MRRLRFFAIVIGLWSLLYTVSKVVDAQVVPAASRPRAMVSGPVDENSLVTLRGNVRPEVQSGRDEGAVADGLPLQHMWLQLKRAPEQQAALDSLVEQLHKPGSPLYHQWLTPAEFGQTFGVAPADLAKVTAWLESHGMTVNHVYANGILIDFSGTAGSVRQAFHTEIHSVVTAKGETHIANISDPQIPSALAPVVAGVVRLHDFAPHAMSISSGQASRDAATGVVSRTQPGTNAESGGPKSEFSTTCPASDCNYAQTLNIVAPFDFATIYNTLPLLSGNSAVTGKGQTIVTLEDSDLQAADIATFRSAFLPSGYTGSWKAIHPTGANNCVDPGKNADEIEAAVDAEWAGAVAPNATVETASCQSTNMAFGGLIALENLLNTTNAPAIYSLSYGECESTLGYAQAEAINAAYEQAAAQGASVFVATGNAGGAECDGEGAGYSTSGLSINGYASTPYNVAVGGTDFSDTYSSTTGTYWSTNDNSLYGSAKSYVPEVPWNDSCGGELNFSHQGYADGDNFCNSPNGERSYLTVAATGGGGSTTYPKPSFQAGAGVPNDGRRDIPDISLFAAGGIWGHSLAYCMSDANEGGVQCGYGDTQQLLFNIGGGTGFASSALAGVQALINQKTGEPQGNPNYILYGLAQASYGASGNAACNSSSGTAESSSCIFHDVTKGDNSVPCLTGSTNCLSGSTEQSYGVLSLDNSTAAYQAATGWDFASGIGTPNIANLVNAWGQVSAGAPTVTVTVAPGSALPGQPVTVNVTVAGNGSYPTGKVDLTVSDVAGTLGSIALPIVPATAPACATSCQNSVSLQVTLPKDLPLGAYTLTAAYKSAGEQYAAATGNAQLHVVSNTTSISLTSDGSPNEGQLNVDIALTWTGNAQPTGSILVQAAGLSVPIATLLLPNGGCQVASHSLICNQVLLNFTGPNTYLLTANYSGDTAYAASTSGVVQYVVAGLSASLSALTITPATITQGNPTPVFSVTVYGSSNQGNLVQPTGTVTLSGNNGLNQFASIPLSACQITTHLGTPAGTVCTIPYKNMWDQWGNNIYNITATYTGSGLYNGTVAATAPQTLIIAGGSASTTSITLSPAGGSYAVGSTVTATLVSTGVSGQGHPTGTISISPTGLGLPVSVALPSTCAATNSYTYTCTIQFVVPASAAPGSYSVVAAYPGDAHYNPSSGTTALFVLPSISFSSVDHNFGTVAVGQVATYAVKVTNNMTKAFPFYIQLTGDPQYTLSNGCPATIAAGASCELTFSYKPTSAASNTASWSIGNGGITGITYYPADGGVLTGTGSTTQQVTLTSDGHDWGKQDIGSVSQVYGTVLTNGTQDPLAVTITLSGDTGDFHTYAINCGSTLAANASCNLQYQFTPQSTGAKQELVNISLKDTVTGKAVPILSGGVVVSGLTLSGTGQ